MNKHVDCEKLVQGQFGGEGKYEILLKHEQNGEYFGRTVNNFEWLVHRSIPYGHRLFKD